MSTTPEPQVPKVLRQIGFRKGAVKPEDVEPIPVWERDMIRWDEIPALIKRLYNLDFKLATVSKWMNYGLVDPNDRTKMIVLKRQRISGRCFVAKQDLIAFLNAQNSKS